MKKTYFLGLVLFSLLIFITLWLSVGISAVNIYVDFLSLILILLCSIFLLLANYSLGEIRMYFSLGFRKADADKTDITNGILFFTSLQKYLILSGLMGTFIGIIAVLANLNNPEVTGSGLALSLMTVLYAIILSMGIVVPFRTGLQKRLNEIVK